jgi:hypothetical protein
MALHDFYCPRCGQVLLDVNIPIAIGAMKGAPAHCGAPAQWIAAVGRMDAYEPFQEFVARDGQNNPVLIDSLRKLRRVEEDSQHMAANGEGQPLVWRRYSNDRSNFDQHTLAPGWQGGAQPDPAWVKKHRQDIRRDEGVASTDYGPGISDATPSPLDALEKRS